MKKIKEHFCKQCGNRIITPTDSDFNPLYKIHSSKHKLQLCYHCVGMEDKCCCKNPGMIV